MMKQQYKTDEYVVAFVDLLGATTQIMKDPDASLNVVHEVYNSSLKLHDALFVKHNQTLAIPVVKIFSDNIVVAVETKPKGRWSAFISTVIFTALVQVQFLIRGYLVRGGICIGDFFADDTMVWGRALVAAHELESEVAIHPRVILHPKMVAELGIAVDSQKQNWLQQDADGLFYIDYLQPRMLKEQEQYDDLVLKCYADIDRMIAEAGDRIKILQKINWHLGYMTDKLGLSKLTDGGEIENA